MGKVNAMLDAPAFSSDRGRRFVSNASLLISVPILLISAYEAYATTQERIEKEKAVALMKTLIDEGKGIVVALDSEGRFLCWPKSAEDVFGYTAEEMIGQTPSILIPEDMREAHARAYDRLVNTTNPDDFKTSRVRCIGVTKDGKKHKLLITTRPVLHEQLGRVVLAFIDHEKDVVTIDATSFASLKTSHEAEKKAL